MKIEEKLLWTAYRNSPTLFRTVLSRPLQPLFPQNWGFAAPTENCNLKFRAIKRLLLEEQHVWTAYRNSSTLFRTIRAIGIKDDKILRKVVMGVVRESQTFSGHPYTYLQFYYKCSPKCSIDVWRRCHIKMSPPSKSQDR